MHLTLYISVYIIYLKGGDSVVTVSIIKGNKISVLNAEKGQKLSDILMSNSADFQHPCAGKGICRKCTVSVNGEDVLSCRYIIESDITVILPEDSISPTETAVKSDLNGKVNIAVDIGTTTLEAVLTDENGNVSDSVKMLNPQKIFGADVISRTDYCRKNGTSELQSVLINSINSLCGKLLEKHGITSADTMYIAGNTTMLHTFFGEDCSGIGLSPYTPVFLEGRQQKASESGIKKVRGIVSLPNISAFIGADIVAGLNMTEIPSDNRFNLLIDLGTNAEIVLFSDKKTICTTAAAGPCFEGANISCGMSALRGAVYRFSFLKGAETIGNAKAEGLCATGLIDVIAELLTNGYIDETGCLSDEKFRICDDVFITQEDIRKYQFAKSAVYSAVCALLKISNITFRDIDKAYISGGFSEKLNISNAILTGLLPVELQSRYTLLGNSALSGMLKYIRQKNDLSRFTENADCIDLASDSFFADSFIKNMTFPEL